MSDVFIWQVFCKYLNWDSGLFSQRKILLILDARRMVFGANKSLQHSIYSCPNGRGYKLIDLLRH